MADKEIIINNITVANGTGVKESIETSTNTTTCFDGVIPQGSPQISFTLEIDRFTYETKEDYVALRDQLLKMLSIPGEVATRETIYHDPTNPYTIVRYYSDCILDGKDYEMKPDEHSAQNLKFICGKCKEEIE